LAPDYLPVVRLQADEEIRVKGFLLVLSGFFFIFALMLYLQMHRSSSSIPNVQPYYVTKRLTKFRICVNCSGDNPVKWTFNSPNSVPFEAGRWFVLRDQSPKLFKHDGLTVVRASVPKDNYDPRLGFDLEHIGIMIWDDLEGRPDLSTFEDPRSKSQVSQDNPKTDTGCYATFNYGNNAQTIRLYEMTSGCEPGSAMIIHAFGTHPKTYKVETFTKEGFPVAEFPNFQPGMRDGVIDCKEDVCRFSGDVNWTTTRMGYQRLQLTDITPEADR